MIEEIDPCNIMQIVMDDDVNFDAANKLIHLL